MARETYEQRRERLAAIYRGEKPAPLTKGPTGGVVSPMNPAGVRNPIVGTGYTLPGDVAAVPTGNWDGMQPSKYNRLAGKPPPNFIAEVDEARNWYSPFQPIDPFGPPAVLYPRAFDYPTGTNLNVVPQRMQFFEQLQAMSRGWGLLRSVIETRKDQFMRMPWAFQVRGKPKAKSARADELTEFFRRPDGKTTFSTWRRKLLEDLFVIDAPSVYVWEALGGKPLALEVLNGATIKPLIDDAGRRPDYPSPAFQQIIKGLPMTNFDERELIYAPMRSTPQEPRFGYSPVEQIYADCVAGLKRQLYQISFWTEGSMPEMIITVPETWTPQQTAMFQAHFDALMSGNVQYKSKVRFMPGGMKPFDIRNANGEALKSDIDEWNARIVCYAFSVSPQPFVREMNRATAETATEQAEEEGLHPLMTWFKEEIMDPIVQEKFGYDEVEFNFTPEPEVDKTEQMTMVTGYVKAGIWTADEGREASGKEPMGGAAGELAVFTAAGPVPLEESFEAARAEANATPEELDRQAENHALSVQGQKKDLKAEVGKAADSLLEGGYQRGLAALARRGAARGRPRDAGGPRE